MNTKQTEVRSTVEALSVENTLKLALEALEYLPEMRGIEEAITAIREALAEQPAPVAKPHEQQEPVACIGYWNQKTGAYYKPDQISAAHKRLIEDGILRRCYTSPPAQQEPVAWVDPKHLEWLAQSPDNLTGAGLAARQRSADMVPLYTSPQPSKPLTDEQIAAAMTGCGPTGFGFPALRRVARAIEAAHGIKGDA